MKYSSKRVLVACECSQTSLALWYGAGFDAYSCDILPPYPNAPYPERHIQGDALKLLDDKWDLIIAHPPCTYLSKLNAPLIHKCPERAEFGWLAKDFFMKFYNANCPHICVENPAPLKLWGLPTPSQCVHPYQFSIDEPFTKYTCLWLKGLPPILPLYDKPPGTRIYVYTCSSKDGSRSKSFNGIAQACFDTWKDCI